MTDALVEALASRVHQAWLEANQAQGLGSRLSAWGEEQMTHYEGLSEQAKGLDRIVVRTVLGALTERG